MRTTPISQFEAARHEAVQTANAADAYLWRWFCEFFEEGRLRWCKAAAGWLISIDHKHLATEASFYEAVRIAKNRFEVGVRRKAADHPTAGNGRFDRLDILHNGAGDARPLSV